MSYAKRVLIAEYGTMELAAAAAATIVTHKTSLHDAANAEAAAIAADAEAVDAANASIAAATTVLSEPLALPDMISGLTAVLEGSVGWTPEP